MAYDHLVRVDELSRELRIYRIDEAGHQTLFTATKLPTGQGWNAEVETLAKQLGENLLLDSPSARNLLRL